MLSTAAQKDGGSPKGLTRRSRACGVHKRTKVWSTNSCETLVGVGHRTRSGKIVRREIGDPKTRCLDELVNLPIEMASACDAPPKWREPVLPGGHARIGSAAMFE